MNILKNNKMKIIKILLFAFLLVSCVPKRLLNENMLYITRRYCGNFDTLYVERKCTKIVTTENEFYIVPPVYLNIPKNSMCYIKYFPELLSGTKHKVWILYFTWEGTSDFYMLRQNYITGKVY